MHNSELAAEPEIAGKAGNVPLCENKLTMFADRMEAFAKELKAVLPSAEAESRSQGIAEFLEQKVRESSDLLEDFETAEAIKCLNELSKFTFDQKTDVMLEEAIIAANEFNHEKAILLLKAILGL